MRELFRSWKRSIKVLISAPILQQWDPIAVFFWSEYALTNAEQSGKPEDVDSMQRHTAESLLDVIAQCQQCSCGLEIDADPGSKMQVSVILSALHMDQQHGDIPLQLAASKLIACFNACREELSHFALSGATCDVKRTPCNCVYQAVLRSFCAAYHVYEVLYIEKTTFSETLLTCETKRVLKALADDHVLSLEDIVCFSPTMMVLLPRMLVLSASLSSEEVIESMRFVLSQELGPGRRNSGAFRTITNDLQLVNYKTYSLLQQGPAAICAETDSYTGEFEYDAEFRRLWMRVCALGHSVLQGTTTSAWGRIFGAACASFDIESISLLSA